MDLKNKVPFKYPMLKSERIAGYIYLPIHAVVLIFFMPAVCVWLFGDGITTAEMNLCLYALSFLVVLITMFRFLRASFSDFFDNVIRSLQTVALGYVFYYVMMFAVSLVILLAESGIANPNTEAILQETRLNKNVMIVVAVLFAPIVEESLFRGAVFGSIRQKNRAAAYIVSTLLFAVYHLWQYFYVDGFSWTLALYLLQYIPPSIALAWSYERSSSIWSPILIHAFINLLSITVSLNL